VGRFKHGGVRDSDGSTVSPHPTRMPDVNNSEVERSESSVDGADGLVPDFVPSIPSKQFELAMRKCIRTGNISKARRRFASRGIVPYLHSYPMQIRIR
jgi:hypothetical protein